MYAGGGGGTYNEAVMNLSQYLIKLMSWYQDNYRQTIPAMLQYYVARGIFLVNVGSHENVTFSCKYHITDF